MCVSCQKLLINQCFGTWNVFPRNNAVSGGEVAASSVTRIQLLVTSSVNPAETGSWVGSIHVCVWGGQETRTGSHSSFPRSPGASQAPHSITNPHHRGWLWLSRLEKPGGRRQWVGGAAVGWAPAWESRGCCQFSADSFILLNIIMFIVFLNPVVMGMHFRKLSKHR